MKALLQTLALLVVVTIASCSTEDSAPNNSLAGENGFEFNSTAYITDYIYVTQDNKIILSSASLNGRSLMNNVHFASFATASGDIQKRTYNVGSGLSSCTAIASGTWNGETIGQGEGILGEENATTGFMRVINIDRIEQDIDIIFEFQRTDGQLVAGSYTGKYEIIEL